MKIFFLFFCISSALASESPLKVSLSGNIEAQTRQSSNSTAAQEELFQDWDRSDFSLIMGNLHGKIQLKESRIELNWFNRQTYSPLYDKTNILGGAYLAPRIWNFPNKLVARDMFKLQHNKQTGASQIDSVLNKFFYEWDHDDTRFILGRMFINYGVGEIFNPINPFNQPTGLTSQSGVAQGNDGGKVSFFLSEKSTIEFYLLGDKAIDGYEGQINKTGWVHGEYRANEKLQLDYVFGEDQKRQKAGGQASYVIGDGLLFTQVLYQSSLVNKKPSQQLWDVMLGYDEQFTNDWHMRVESGYQKRDEKISSANSTDFSDRFLPSEYFVAFANEYQIHPLVKVSGTLIHDIKTYFGYGLARLTWSVFQNWEAEMFGFTPVYKNGEKQQIAQKLITTDVGLALRAFF